MSKESKRRNKRKYADRMKYWEPKFKKIKSFYYYDLLGDILVEKILIYSEKGNDIYVNKSYCEYYGTFPPFIYNVSEVLEGIEENQIIYLTRSERIAEMFIQKGLIGTTLLQGIDRDDIPFEILNMFKGANIFICAYKEEIKSIKNKLTGIANIVGEKCINRTEEGRKWIDSTF